MVPYRVRADANEVHITVLRPTFGGRLRAKLRANRSVLAIVGMTGTLLAVALTSIAFIDDSLFEDVPIALVFCSVWLVFGGVPLTIFVALLAAKSLEPSPLESMLPAAITMRDDGLVVTPQSGPPQPARWTWLAGARDFGDIIELSLAHDKPISLRLSCDRVIMERVRAWLTDNRIFRP